MDDTSARLPLICYGTHPSDQTLVMLKAGEVGYWPTEGYSMGFFKSWDEVADMLNEQRGISKAQRAAMEAGSMFGFDVPGANPANYDANGRFVKVAK